MTAASIGDRRPRLIGIRDAALFAVVTFVPLLLGGRGRLNADTKQYLYLDPSDLLDRARSLWDPAVGGGTVTHQTVGYLWPMGPYYWLAEAVGLPDWVAQRLWIGGIQFAAALGVLALLRYLTPRHPAQLVGAALYGLSPFVLGHVTGQSALLLPFAAFGWLVLCVIRAVDEGGWRWPAVFALVVTTCGSLNGSSVFFVILGAVLWVPIAVWQREATTRHGVLVVMRLAALTVVTQLWWLTAYAVGGRHGLPILSITETVQATSGTTSAAEVLRGLGYWFFYGRDPHLPWLDNLAPTYVEAPVAIVVTFLVPVAALALGGVVRWGQRVYFTSLVLVGTVIAVGAFPEPQSPLGSAFESASRRSDLVLSLRNTQRAAPLVVLGLAALAAAGLGALQRRHARSGIAAMAVMTVLVAGTLPQWRAGLIADRFHREAIPEAWLDATAHLDEGSGRVLELPGIDFASYRWGHTLDPIAVGLTDRSVLARELVPMGGTPGVSLLAALDRSIQEGTFEPRSLGPVARLLGATDVLVRNDLEYERYRTARPHRVWPLFVDPATGLDPPRTFGPSEPNRAVDERPMIDETELGIPLDTPVPPQIAVFVVPGSARAALSAEAVGGGVVVDGDGDGVVAAAAAGLLDDIDGPLLLAADLLGSDGRVETSTDSATRYIVTDTNRKRAERWYSLRENGGATEPADMGVVLDDPSDARLEIVPDVGIESRTVVQWSGAERVWASTYGNPFTLAPEDRPSNAFDGDPRTVASGRQPDSTRRRAHRHRARCAQLRRPDPARATHRPAGYESRHPSRITLDGTRRFEYQLDEELARDPAGVVVELDGEPFQRLEVEMLAVAPESGLAGFAEIEIPGVTVDEVVVLPTGLLQRIGTDVSNTPLAFVLTRQRADASEVVRADPEPALVRTFELAGDVELRLEGTARIHANASDDIVDAALGMRSATAGGWTARATEHLAGSVDVRAAAAFDSDIATAWTTPLVGITGQTIELDAGRTVQLDQLELDVVTDEHHSAPTRLLVSIDGQRVFPLTLPELPAGDLGTTQRVRLPLPEPLVGQVLQITVDGATPCFVADWYSNDPVALPVAIAEIHVPSLPPAELPASIDSGCRDDLLMIDDAPVGIRITGTGADAVAGSALAIELCGSPIELSGGTHQIRAAAGLDSGFDLDRLVLTTPAWDAPSASADHVAPEVEVTSASATEFTATVDSSDGAPFWLVLDQSMNDGWDLTIDGATVDGPRPVDSYATGWLVTPDGPGVLEVKVGWPSQRAVDIALVVSALAALGCLAFAITITVRRHRRGASAAIDRAAPALDLGWAGFAPVPISRRAWFASVVGSAMLAALVIHPLAAIGAGVLVALALRLPLVGRLLPAALVGLAMMQVLGFQMRDRHELRGDWPQWFGGAHVAAMLAVIVLGITAMAEPRERSAPSESTQEDVLVSI